MTTILDYNAAVIPLGSSPEDMRTTVDNLLIAKGYQRIFKTIEPTTILGTGITGDPAKAFDGNDIEYSPIYFLAVGSTLGVQMATAVEFTHVTIFRGVVNTNLTDFVIERSDDNVTWTGCGTYSGIANWMQLESRDFPITGTPGAHAYWRIRATGMSGANCDIGEIRFFTAAGDFACSQKRSYFIPPVTETVGSTYGRGVLAIVYTGTAIQFIPELEIRVALPPLIVMANKTSGAGAVICSATINGATVSITGTSGNSSQTNLRLLYEAIRNSANAAFTAYSWTWQQPAAQNADDTTYLIIGIKIVADDHPTVSGSNADVYLVSSGAAPGVRIGTAYIPYPVKITVDLINGFVLFWQISNRALAFGTKTNANYFGAIHAAWADHTKAVASMPNTLDPRFITPIELVTGVDAIQANGESAASVSHCWALPNAQHIVAPNFSGQMGYGGHPAYGASLRSIYMDGTPLGHSGTTDQIQIPLRGSAIFTGADAMGNDFQIHQEKMVSVFSKGVSMSTNGTIGEAIVPVIDIMDWYKFMGAATNEALTMVSDIVQATTLNQAMDNTTSYTTLDVVSAALLATSGYIIIENEVVLYAGKTGNTLTGVVRSQFGSPKQSHWAGDAVYQGLWFTVINGGALFAGTTKPI